MADDIRVPLLWVLTAAFSLRVAAQALQRWVPQSFLPQFGAFQGSNLSYPILLGAQLVILALKVRACRNVQRRGSPSKRLGRALTVAGAIYLAVSLARIAIGLFVASAPDWFRAWIPAAFHLVLATFVLTLATYHGDCSNNNWEQS